jgi:GNAT superfamily N-acetyltransferase
MYFGCAISKESISTLVDHMIDNDENHRVVVAEDDQLEIVGTVHMAIISDTEVELGVMVSEAYRGKGVSSIMMEYALNLCRNRNFDSVTMFCLSYNAPILHVVKKYGLEISEHLGNSEAKLALPRATIFTLGRENLANHQSFIKQNVMSFRRMLLAPH